MEEIETKKNPGKTKAAFLDLMLIKALACTLIIIALLVVKKNNSEMFGNLREWYHTNINAQSIDLIEAKNQIYNLGLNVIQNVVNSAAGLKENEN